jgi:hypothetical protein
VVRLFGWGISLSQAPFLHSTTQTQKERSSTPLLRVEFLMTVFERAKTFHALDRAATAIGAQFYIKKYYFLTLPSSGVKIIL